MRGIPLLIKLARTSADERRCELGRIATAHAAAQAALVAHDDVAMQEDRLAAETIEARAAHAAWLRADQRRRAGLAARQAQLDRTEEAARAALREAVAGLKRLETVQRTAAMEARRVAARREAARADELHALLKGR